MIFTENYAGVYGDKFTDILRIILFIKERIKKELIRKNHAIKTNF